MVFKGKWWKISIMIDFTVKEITDPSPVWDKIKSRMTDDSGHGEYSMDGNLVGVFDGEFMAAAFRVFPWSEICFQMHGGVHPKYWGHGAEICYVFGLALFQTTGCLKIVAIVPEFNRLMINCLLKCGLKHEGKITKSFLKWGKLHDQCVLGIQRREGMPWPQQFQS